MEENNNQNNIENQNSIKNDNDLSIQNDNEKQNMSVIDVEEIESQNNNDSQNNINNNNNIDNQNNIDSQNNINNENNIDNQNNIENQNNRDNIVDSNQRIQMNNPSQQNIDNNQNHQEIQTNQQENNNSAQIRNVTINQTNDINTNYQNNQEQVIEKYEITYEKNELVSLMTGSKLEAKNNKEKIKINQYSFFDIDDPELFDGKIKCIRLKCILYGIITFFINTIRLFYLIFLHLGYPAIIWLARFTYVILCYCCILCSKEEVVIEPESGRERIDIPSSNCDKSFLLCKNCGTAFCRCLINFVKCPVWFYSFIVDCFYDIKNRALDNARTGCYKFIHYDCGYYEKIIENPFNNYMKKRHIILTTDPDDEAVIYGDACQDNTII